MGGSARKRVLITGAAGYLGTALIQELVARPWCEGIDALDLRPLRSAHEGVRFEARDAFNIAPPDTVSMGETLRSAGKPVLRLPGPALTLLVALAWWLRLPLLRAPASLLDYFRYPWVLDTTRLRDELGYTVRHSSAESLALMLRSKGLPAD